MAIRKGLVLAMEEENSELVGVPKGDGSEVSELESGEVAADVSESEDEVEDFSGDIEGADGAVDTLVDAVDVAEDSVTPDEEGGEAEGLPPVAAEMMGVIIRDVCQRLGIESDNMIPAAESFGSTNSRVAATRVAIEESKNVIARAWEAIKNAFKSLWAKVVEFLTHLFNSNAKLKKAIESCKANVKVKTEGKTASVQEIENSGVWSVFSAGVGSADAKVDLETVKTIGANVDKGLGFAISTSQEYQAYYSKLEQFVKNLKEVGWFESEKRKAAQNELAVHASHIKTAAGKEGGTNGFALTKGFVIKITGDTSTTNTTGRFFKKETDKSADEITATEVNVEEEKVEHAKGKSSNKVAVLDSKELVSLIGEAEKVLGKLEAARSLDPKKAHARFEKLINEASKYASNFKTEENKEGNTRMNEAFKLEKALITHAGKTEIAISTKFPKHGVWFINGCINYANACAKAYGEAKK